MTIKQTPVEEGEITFQIDGVDEPCKTWYRVYGDLSAEVVPVVALHGGPGVGKPSHSEATYEMHIASTPILKICS
jgi:hypothetical protein